MLTDRLTDEKQTALVVRIKNVDEDGIEPL